MLVGTCRLQAAASVLLFVLCWEVMCFARADKVLLQTILWSGGGPNEPWKAGVGEGFWDDLSIISDF